MLRNSLRHCVLAFLSLTILANSNSLLADTGDRPNIIYILSDDMGFSDIGCYGGEIKTPNLDSLADHGVRFTQFYNTARCCPTRASLMSGLYPHQAGVGHMMDDHGYEGYRGELSRHCVTIPEALKNAGYRSYMSGKWHVTKAIDPKTDADKANWPIQRGFDRFYGTIHGAGSFFDPNTLTRDNEFISPFNDPEYGKEDWPGETYYYTDAIADHAARFVRDHHFQSGDQPFFMYVAFTAAHWPMHALDKDIAKYKGVYDAGYDAIRDARYKRMLELGLIDADSTVNWPIPDAWKESEFWEWDKRNMEVYAAMIDSMDQGIGRIVQSLKDTGQFENTLICFLQDNGGCAEGYGRGGVGSERADKPTLATLPADYLQPDMTPKQSRDGFVMRTGKGSMAGPADTAIGYGRGWATVSNTPFREYKHWTHEGGISTPLIAHWPAKIRRHGELETTPGHLIDLMATAVDVSGATYPATYHDGKEIKPMEGKSLVPLFAEDADTRDEFDREAIYWEHEGNRAVRVGDLKLVAKGAKGEWELYNIANDRSEQRDLSSEMPETVQKLAVMWQAYAERANVLPLNPGNQKHAERATMNVKQTRFKLNMGDKLHRTEAPYIKNKAFAVTADIDVKGDGVIVAQGGSSQGWSLYLKNGKLCFGWTQNGKRVVTTSDARVSGKQQVTAIVSKPGTVQLKIGEKQVAESKIDGLLGEQPLDGLQVGQDENGAVGPYAVPFPLQGTVNQVVIELMK
tara:strand:+ start:40697 stop:42922 length:2226 start_codon:yes stop_codon:yes gene_type:complete